MTKVKLAPEVVDPDDIEMLRILLWQQPTGRQLDEFSIIPCLGMVVWAA